MSSTIVTSSSVRYVVLLHHRNRDEASFLARKFYIRPNDALEHAREQLRRHPDITSTRVYEQNLLTGELQRYADVELVTVRYK